MLYCKRQKAGRGLGTKLLQVPKYKDAPPVAIKVFFSPSVRNGLMTTTTCSDHGAGVSFTSVNSDQETSVDYVCTSESGETVRKFQQAYFYSIMSLTAE